MPRYQCEIGIPNFGASFGGNTKKDYSAVRYLRGSVVLQTAKVVFGAQQPIQF